MSVSIAISSAAMGASAVAQQEAHEAEVTACKASMAIYQPQTATVEQMQAYADCVGTVYPQPMTPGDIVAAKILFVIALIGALVGFFTMRDDDYFLRSMVAILGFFILPVGVSFIAGIFYGIYWLFK